MSSRCTIPWININNMDLLMFPHLKFQATDNNIQVSSNIQAFNPIRVSSSIREFNSTLESSRIQAFSSTPASSSILDFSSTKASSSTLDYQHRKHLKLLWCNDFLDRSITKDSRVNSR